MTQPIRRSSPIIFAFFLMMMLFTLILLPLDLRSDSILNATSIESPNSEHNTPTQRLMDKLNELDERHIMREKVISELRYLLNPEGYRALDFRGHDIVARLYLIATLHPQKFGGVLSYHKSALSEFYVECLRTVESSIKLNLDYMHTAAELEKVVTQMVSRVPNADLSSEERRNMAKKSQRLLFVLSLQQHARDQAEWKDTYYGKLESKLAVQRQQVEETFESMLGADFESSLASVIILNWPAWSYPLTCGRNNFSIELSAPEPEQSPSLTPASRAEPNATGSSSAPEPQPRGKKVPTVNTQKKPVRKVTSQEWMQIR